MTKLKSHYVNNNDLYAAMVEYKGMVHASESNKTQLPQVSNYIGECIMKIATHLAYKPNFSNYTFREEMISDGIENCLQYINNFDPNKSKNPFAYFTQIIYFAFIRRIQKEKKYLYTKYSLINRANMFHETLLIQEQDRDKDFDTHIKYGEWPQEQMDTFMKEFEKKQNIKKKIKKKKVVS